MQLPTWQTGSDANIEWEWDFFGAHSPSCHALTSCLALLATALHHGQLQIFEYARLRILRRLRHPRMQNVLSKRLPLVVDSAQATFTTGSGYGSYHLQQQALVG